MATRLTEIYKTDDGKFFGTLAEAEAHEDYGTFHRAVMEASDAAQYNGNTINYPDFLRELQKRFVVARIYPAAR